MSQEDLSADTLSPTVTAIMPVFNGAATVADAIESVIGQSFPDWELLVIDDGSTDTTTQVARSFNDPRITVIRCEENAGRAAARNEALLRARGKYVAPCDGDDISLPERFQRCVDFLEQNREFGIVSGQLLRFGEWGGPTRLYVYPTDQERIDGLLRRGRMPVPHGASLIRREIFDEIGLYNEDFVRCQDLDLFLRAAKVTRMANMEEDLLLYRADRRPKLAYWLENALYGGFVHYRSGAGADSSMSFDEWRRSTKGRVVAARACILFARGWALSFRPGGVRRS